MGHAPPRHPATFTPLGQAVRGVIAWAYRKVAGHPLDLSSYPDRQPATSTAITVTAAARMSLMFGEQRPDVVTSEVLLDWAYRSGLTPQEARDALFAHGYEYFPVTRSYESPAALARRDYSLQPVAAPEPPPEPEPAEMPKPEPIVRRGRLLDLD